MSRGHKDPCDVECSGCGIPLSDGYTTGSDYAPECKPCTDRRTSRLRRGALFSPTGYAGEAICNTTGRIVAHQWEASVT